MATSPTVAASTDPAASLPIHRLDVETYEKMVASGALEDQRVELLEGMVVDMSPQSPAHATVLRRLTWHFAGTRLQVQTPLQVPPSSEPEPDLAVVGAEPAAGQHTRTALFVVEVAVSSHAIDRGAKASLYARAGIPTYWLVDVPGRAVEIRTEPAPDGYRRCTTHHERDGALPCTIDGVAELDLAALFRDI